MTASTTGLPFQILILDNVVSNAGDAAIAIAMKRSLEATFGTGAIVRHCFCGPTSEPGIFRDYYPELSFTRTLWHCESDWSLRKWNIVGRLKRKSAAFRFPLQARLRRRGLPLSVLFAHERALFRLFEESSLVVVTGGAPLCTSWTPRYLRPLRTAQYRAALLLGKPLVFYSQSFGPFAPDDDLPGLLRPVMEKANAILCRDSESVRVVREVIGVSSDNVHETIDEALTIEPRPPTREPAPPRKLPVRIGVCVHQWNWLGQADPQRCQREFESRIAAVCEQLMDDASVELVLLTTHQTGSDDVHSDLDVSVRVVSMIPERLQPRVQVVSSFVHPCEFAHFMGQCDVVLSSRLHGAVLSLVGGAPAIALEYEPKTRGLMRRLGLEDWVLSMADSTSADITCAIRKILDDRRDADQRRQAGVAEGRRVAARSGDIVRRATEPRATGE
jgi:colanic acid/amylovoran biosynthesis protein